MVADQVADGPHMEAFHFFNVVLVAKDRTEHADQMLLIAERLASYDFLSL